MKRVLRFVAIGFVVIAVCVPVNVYADVAPPSHPPGSNPEPDTEGTQVRMMAETVLLEILPNADVDSLGKAKISADFTMRNLGNETESMGVRFPISTNNGFGQYTELENIAVKVNGKTVSTKRVTEADPMWGSDPVPWVQFDVTFPSNQDVQIQVSYVLSGTGEYPFVAYYYILHTGEGWNGTIGSADLIVRLPYEANAFNVIFDEEIGWSFTTMGGLIAGNEIKWHFDDLEPDTSNDFQLSIVNPAVWRKALNEQSNIQKDPNDGEAWGRLGKLYKEMFFFRRDFRHDAGGQQLYPLSVEAYEKAVTLLPDDALWHAGFADLLAVHAYYSSWGGEDTTTETLRSMQEIDRALELSPNDAKVKEIAEKIYWLFPDGVELLESGYDFLWLTATPIAETPTAIPASPTETLEATSIAVFTETAIPTKEAAPNPTPVPPTAKNPLCGSIALAPLALIWFARRKVHS